MDKEKLGLYIVLAIIAIVLLWTANNYFQAKTTTDFATSIPDKCKTPAGYDDAQWKEHMGHHPDQYKECLGGQQASTPASTTFSDEQINDAINKVIPRGEPAIYGKELQVSFEDPVNSMNKLAMMEEQIQLNEVEKQRYIKIGTSISCEYCCGVKSIVDRKGNPACGCAHSSAMRALAKYLVKNHAKDYTDEQILEELVKWKTLFFPKDMIQRYMENGKVW